MMVLLRLGVLGLSTFKGLTKCKVFYPNSHKSMSTIKMSWVKQVPAFWCSS